MSQQAFAGVSFGNPSQSVFETRRSELCQKWVPHTLELADCSLQLYQNLVGDFKIQGTLKGDLLQIASAGSPDHPIVMEFWAANPPTYGASFSGSGLPFPNEQIAFEGTPNKGRVSISGGSFDIQIVYPNSYYADLGKRYVAPQLQFHLVDSRTGRIITDDRAIPLGNGIPFRSLSWPQQRNWMKGPEFYYRPNQPLQRTQEQILRDSAYPVVNQEPEDFWGLTPPSR